jgi:hypothetical protein
MTTAACVGPSGGGGGGFGVETLVGVGEGIGDVVGPTGVCGDEQPKVAATPRTASVRMDRIMRYRRSVICC